MAILRRNLVGLDVLEPWLARVAESASLPSDGDGDPFLVSGNAQSFLRALHLQVALAPRPPVCRADLLLALIDWLKRSNPHLSG